MSTSPATPSLDRATLGEHDTTDQLTDVLALPEHLRDALWKAESANLGTWDSPGGLVVAGMGASAMGGLLARAALADHASRPIFASRAYGLPAWTTPDTTVLCASYTGETEETLACFEAAGALGAKRIVVTTGGALARAAREEDVPVIPIAGGLRSSTAVGYVVAATLEVAAACGVGPRMTAELDVAAEHLEALVSEWGPEGAEDSELKALARALDGTIPVLVGAGLTTPLASRAKDQITRIARTPAFASELPDLGHDEIAGWERAERLGRFSAVFLDDADTHPRVRALQQRTSELIGARGIATQHLATRGETAVERVLSGVLAADLLALYLGHLGGVDPSAPSDVERLQAETAA